MIGFFDISWKFKERLGRIHSAIDRALINRMIGDYRKSGFSE